MQFVLFGVLAVVALVLGLSSTIIAISAVFARRWGVFALMAACAVVNFGGITLVNWIIAHPHG